AKADLDRVDQALADVRSNLETVDKDVRGLGEIHIQQGFRSRIVEGLAVLKNTAEAPPLQIRQPGGQLILGKFLRKRIENVEPCVNGPLHDLIGNLIDCIFLDDRAAFSANRYTHSSKQQPQVIVDLRRRPYCGTWSSCRISLPNSDRRGNA